ncbi:hypothetical protein [Ktedonobacter racemifer]|uniref:Uncharacterized protein n=1 Tax=Ktedonobacter racemifer DSM 44963 TaxID=485913 RepID=D6TX60_KTERA|nr:hypothetical protein [Ktedonobacter racemifer]EFH84793.1 hypothetical protein Krac_5900 [Ktedonobacter racemifer DSM 44963]
MRLTKVEQQYLQQRKPFEGLVWRIDDDGIPCCCVKVPHQISFDRFSLMFDSLELSSSRKSAVLYYGASSYYYDLVKTNLVHVFDVVEDEGKQVLQGIAQSKWIAVCGYSEKGLAFLGRKQIELKPKIRSSLEAIGRNSKPAAKMQQVAKAQNVENKRTKSETHHAFAPLKPGELLSFPVIERCRYQLQKEIHQASNQNNSIQRQVFWRLLLLAGLEQARSFSFYTDAINMIEQKRVTLKHSNRPVLTPEFHVPHLWFGFFQPMKTLVCPDTAAIFLFSASDSSLREHSSMLRSVSDQEWKKLYEQERDFISLNVVNTQGKIVWSMNLPTTVEEARKHIDYPWVAPVWFQCFQGGACQIPKSEEVTGSPPYSYQLCKQCRQAQLFFSTWLMTAWQALMGAYRDDDLDTIGSERVEHFQMASLFLRNGKADRNNTVEHRYQIIIYKDISSGLNSPWHSVLHPTGSWVEALMAFDPESLTWQERSVMPHYRVLRSLRYKEPGTKIPVRGHKRNTPMRADRLDMPRDTRVRARQFDYEDEE